jgi:hypothetical protein
VTQPDESSSDDPRFDDPRLDERAAAAESDGHGEDDPLDHLWNAAHEMLRAMRGVIEAADEFVESQRNRPARTPAEPREGRVHRIDIDARPDAP